MLQSVHAWVLVGAAHVKRQAHHAHTTHHAGEVGAVDGDACCAHHLLQLIHADDTITVLVKGPVV